MRIALDATPLIEPAGGIARYVTELALALADGASSDEIHLLSDQSELHLDERLRDRPNIRLDPPAGWGRSKWWSLGLPLELRRRGVEIFHGTNFEIPYFHASPAVVTVHDLSPWKQPPLRPPGCEHVRSRGPRSIRAARRVITPTDAVRKEVSEIFGTAPEKVTAIPHAPTDALQPPAPGDGRAIRKRMQLPAQYLLAIGAGNARKNIPLLVEAWRACLPAFGELALVVIGLGSSEATHPPGPGELITIEAATDAETAAVLSGAAAFVYPSLYEGFGLPLVEAMRAGVPVISSTDAALVETAQGAALHFDPTSACELSEAIGAVLSDPAQAERLRELGARRAASLSWRETAARTRDVYEQALLRR